MSNCKSWLSTYYTGNTYESEIDTDIAIARRRKALKEISDLIRQKCLQQIDNAIKQQ